MSETKDNSTRDAPPKPDSDADQGGANQGDAKVLNRVIKRFGGRHLIFRTQLGNSWRVLPKPYAMVSTFRGPVWFFYGIGQVWVTHKKYHEFDGWLARVPRVGSPKLISLLDKLEQPLTEFTHFCNENGIEGTIVVEANVIEFHWTFEYAAEKEQMKQDHTDILDAPFKALVDHYLVAKSEVGI
jgi:hypothetical protein